MSFLLEEEKQKRKAERQAAAASFAKRLEKKLLAEEQREKAKNAKKPAKPVDSQSPVVKSDAIVKPVTPKNTKEAEAVKLEKIRQARKMKNRADEKQRLETAEKTKFDEEKFAFDNLMKEVEAWEKEQEKEGKLEAINRDFEAKLGSIMGPSMENDRIEDERTAARLALRKKNIPKNETLAEKRIRIKREEEEDERERILAEQRMQMEIAEIGEKFLKLMDQKN